MLTATAFALAGTLLFLALLRRVPLRTPFIVPLIGLILGGVIHAATTFVAVRYDLLQSLHAWTTAISRACCAAAMSCCGSAWADPGRLSGGGPSPWPAWAGNSPPTWA